jgi:hypothetical protein
MKRNSMKSVSNLKLRLNNSTEMNSTWPANGNLAWVVKKFPYFYGKHRSITVFRDDNDAYPYLSFSHTLQANSRSLTIWCLTSTLVVVPHC